MPYKHLFFDLDKTITRSRSPLSPRMKQVFTMLVYNGYDITVVSGALVAQSRKQMEEFHCLYLGQNGNHAIDFRNGTEKELWFRRLSETEKKEIWDHINAIPRTWEVRDEHDLVQDRGCQITYSLIGANEVLEKKEAFDPKGLKRKALLQKFPFVSNTLEVKLGGTTSFDYNRKGSHKGSNVSALIDVMQWDKKRSLYVGDALFPGGNDEAVIGVIDTKQIKDPTETLAFLNMLLLENR